MPEGDAVFRTARRLDRALAGHVLTASDFRVPAARHRRPLRGPRRRHRSRAASTCSPGSTTATERWTLHTHLKMEGSAGAVYERGQRGADRATTARVVLTTDDGQRRRVLPRHRRAALPREREEEPVGHLGPDLLGPDWDADEAVRRLREHPDTPIGDALLDQRNLAGIGNMWARRGVLRRPGQPAGERCCRARPDRAGRPRPTTSWRPALRHQPAAAVGLRPQAACRARAAGPRSAARTPDRSDASGRRTGARPASRPVS